MSRAYRVLWTLSPQTRLPFGAGVVVELLGVLLFVETGLLSAELVDAFSPTQGGDPSVGSHVARWMGATSPAALVGVWAVVIVIGTGMRLGGVRLQELASQTLGARAKAAILEGMLRARPEPETGPAMYGISAGANALMASVRVLVASPLVQLIQLVYVLVQIGRRSDAIIGFVYLAAVVFASLGVPRLVRLDARVAETSAALDRAASSELHTLSEVLSARKLIRALRAARGATALARTRFEATRLAVDDSGWAGLLRGLTNPAVQLATVMLLFAAGIRGADRQELVALVLLSTMVPPAVMSFEATWVTWSQLAPAAKIASDFIAISGPVAPSVVGGAPPRVEVMVASLRPPGFNTPLLEDVRFHVPSRRVTALVGRGASGKSSLLDVLSGQFLGEVGGSIQFDELELELSERERIDSHVLRLNQHPELLTVSVEDFVTFGMEGTPRLSVREALAMVGLEDVDPASIIQQTFVPSGFQRQALRLAQLLVREIPALVLLDEPDSAMSPMDAVRLHRTIQATIAGRATVLMITHQLAVLEGSTHVVFVRRGGVVEGSADTLRAEDSDYRELLASSNLDVSA